MQFIDPLYHVASMIFTMSLDWIINLHPFINSCFSSKLILELQFLVESYIEWS